MSSTPYYRVDPEHTGERGREVWILGPPGTGKTSFLAGSVRNTALLRGNDKVVVTSFTTAAAAELTSRQLPLPKGQVGTLHALAYRALEFPGVAEEKLDEWNDAHPAYAMSRSGKRVNVDDGTAPVEPASDGASEGDVFAAQLDQLRARRVPVDQWPAAVRTFAAVWDKWKRGAGVVDFTDMIELALEQVPTAPAHPDVIFADEAQDFTPLELALVRKWGQRAERLILAGDPHQSIYGFKGATPDAWLDSPVADSDKIVLSQSWRIPSTVHGAAEHWIRQLSRYEPMRYDPRAEPGDVRTLAVHYQQPHMLADALERAISKPAYDDDGTERPATAMVLAPCGYMLDRLKRELRERGLPFHNPYRRCSPPDEPVLTDHGYVPIGDLDPARHRLVGYYAKTNSLSRGPHWTDDLATSRPSGVDRQQRRGFDFTVGHRPYSGRLLTLTTRASRTRVTPNHRVRVRFNESASRSWSVYLMRRGDDWRVGMSRTRTASNRLRNEGGDAIWLLSTHRTRSGATLEEARVHAAYGLTGMTFNRHAGKGVWTQAELDRHHRSLRAESGKRAAQLLVDVNLLVESPLVAESKAARLGYAFETVAANVVPGVMDLPLCEANVVDRRPPTWAPVDVDSEWYDGDVYSLDVPGPEHYVSGGAVVHNSRGDWNPMRTGPGSGVSSRERLVAYLMLDEREQMGMGDLSRPWTGEDVRRWAHVVRKRGLFVHGAAGILEALPDRELTFDEVAGLFADQDQLEAAVEPDLRWLERNLTSAARGPMGFPIAVARERGARALLTEPQIIIGTIHSVKGGVADDVYLIPDLSARGMNEWRQRGAPADGVRRLMYVGMTRARRSLTVLQPGTGLHVPVEQLVAGARKDAA